MTDLGLRTPVVYVATYGTGNTDYPAFLYISLFSVLRLHHASVTIITDEHTQFVPFITQHATIKRVSMPQSLTTKQKSRFLKTQVGNLINGRFLYLDCDTILVRPIKEIDTCDCDIACAIEYNSPFVHDNGYIDSNTREIERTNRNFYYNSGVILSCGSYGSKCFFTSWHKNWIKYAKKTGKDIDQPSLYTTNIEMHNFIQELPSKFNWMTYMHTHICPDCRILHSWCNMNRNPYVEEVLSYIQNGKELTKDNIDTLIQKLKYDEKT